jgi:hypothetical protein
MSCLCPEFAFSCSLSGERESEILCGLRKLAIGSCEIPLQCSHDTLRRGMVMKRSVLLLILLVAGCTANHLPPSNTNQGQSSGNTPLARSVTAHSPMAAPPASQESAIRSVDFRNFTYDWYPAWADATPAGRRIILKDGEMNLGYRQGKEPFKFYLPDTYVEYGDLTGDGVQEAVVTIGIIMSGTARPDLVFVYTPTSTSPKRLWVYETGDRAHRGLHRAFVENGSLVIEQYQPDTANDKGKVFELPTSHQYMRDYYKWTGHRFEKTKTDSNLPLDANDTSPWTKN